MNILHEAAEYIRDHGWTRGDLENKHGNVCSLGALSKVTSLNTAVGKEVTKTMADAIRKHDKRMVRFGCCDKDFIIVWNDRLVKDADQVIEMFKLAAEEWDIRHG